MNQGLSISKSFVPIKTFVFPKPEMKRDRSFSIRTECKNVTIKVRTATSTKCNMKISAKKIEDNENFTQLPLRSQTMSFEESFFSYGTEPCNSVSKIRRFTLPFPLNTTKNNDSLNIISFSPEILPKTSITLKSPASKKQKFRTIKRFSKVEKDPMKDWIIEESISFTKPAYLMKPNSGKVSKTRIFKNPDNDSKKRIVTAWVPQAIPFLTIGDS